VARLQVLLQCSCVNIPFILLGILTQQITFLLDFRRADEILANADVADLDTMLVAVSHVDG